MWNVRIAAMTAGLLCAFPTLAAQTVQLDFWIARPASHQQLYTGPSDCSPCVPDPYFGISGFSMEGRYRFTWLDDTNLVPLDTYENAFVRAQYGDYFWDITESPYLSFVSLSSISTLYVPPTQTFRLFANQPAAGTLPNLFLSGDGVSFDDQSGHHFFYSANNVNYRFAVVPEPATWALLIAGFGLAGAGLRSRRRAIAG